MPPKHAEQNQIDTKWLQKKLVFDVSIEEYVKA